MYSVLSTLRYDPTSQCYSSVLSLDRYPDNPALQQIVKKTQIYKLSPFDVGTKCNPRTTCGNNFIIPGTQRVATLNDLPIIMGALRQLNYKINTQITMMLNTGSNSDSNLLFYITAL